MRPAAVLVELSDRTFEDLGWEGGRSCRSQRDASREAQFRAYAETIVFL
jgi:hypothetical protein